MDKDVLRLRRFNRFYTGFLGLLGRDILGGPLSLGQARLLYEIGRDPDCRAAELADRLRMDKGYLSRMLAGLTAKGLMARKQRASDRRSASLRLTAQGRDLLAELETRSNAQARSILSALAEPARRSCLAAMNTLEAALRSGPDAPPEPHLREHGPGDLGYVVESHGRLYHQEYGFDAGFEGYVIDGLHEFLRADPEDRLLLVAEAGARPVGTVGVMPRPDGPWQVRWFLVEPEYRSQGLGRTLFCAAMDFARGQGAPGLHLWTLDMLAPARRLYQSLGFTLAETKPGSMGGLPMTEERWELAF